MKRSDEKSSAMVRLDDHPDRARARIAAIVDRGAVQMNRRISDLSGSRRVQISEIWQCLESGDLVEGTVRSGDSVQTAEMVKAWAGRDVRIKIAVCRSADGIEQIEVLSAEADEEEE